ncbi:tyrosine-type recombinase/integrase [Schinkia azotoformans]|uniref:tyrosine-type recombinase/integrase n=1 Tax=Schinkia azotoformans TaxID=1454 RepID=UPI002DB70D87|nr:site-specific integrase [Schinkia azotoformans]MEC1714770.1 site-specific integrase [Schinkia azotoformans]MEC1757474.1 site-specific integrase [Schinkia azotoformans]
MGSRKIVDKNLYEKEVSKQNKILAKDFLIEKKSQDMSHGTIRQYSYDIRIINYLVYQHFENKRLIELTRKDIRNLSMMFQEMGMSNSRVNGIMSCLRSCLEYATDDDDYEYEFNVGSKVKGLKKVPVKEITFLSEEQIHWLRDQLLARNEIIKALYLMLSYISAARKNEVHQVKKEGLTGRYFSNVVRGKGNKPFRLYYTKEVQDLIKQYLEIRGEDDLPELFVRVYKSTGERRAYSHDTFGDWCEYFSKLLYMKEGRYIHINPHCLRHSRLDILNHVYGIPIEKLRTLANHESIETTAGYLAKRDEDDIAFIFGMKPEDFKQIGA